MAGGKESIGYDEIKDYFDCLEFMNNKSAWNKVKAQIGDQKYTKESFVGVVMM